ncbi:MAG TPA: MFS transporter [Thermoanaerobaculia bacterium]|nr:MFS transporter [Thermoanaerobaculia bacterium]
MNLNNSRWQLPAIVAILYFTQGFPFGIYDRTMGIYLRQQHVSLAQIGFVSSVGLAWSLKPLWAPLVDTFGSYRSWILGSLAVLCLAIGMFAATPAASTMFWAAAILLAFASATQDIAIDALTIRITPDPLIGRINSIRVTAARIAFIAMGGGLATLSDSVGWDGAFLAAAALAFAVLVIVALFVPHDAGRMERHENLLKALGDWLRRNGALVFAVVLIYRLGDSALRPMIAPYWIDRGYSATEVGNVTTTIGMVCVILGAISGGWFVTRFGIFHGLVWLGIVQMLSNLGYAVVASTSAGRPGLYAAAVAESFCDGLGTAAFLSFLMSICDRENAATEYAVLTATFALPRTVIGATSGWLTESMGYAGYYWLTAALALPGLLLLPLVRARVSTGAAAAR